MGISHSWNGTVLTITSDSGTSSADLKGDIGIRGPQGVAGSIDTSRYYTKDETETFVNDAIEYNRPNLSLLATKADIKNLASKDYVSIAIEDLVSFNYLNTVVDGLASEDYVNTAIRDIDNTNMELLWQNDSPNSEFIGQTINHDFSNFTHYLIDFVDSTPAQIVRKGKTAYCSRTAVSKSEAGNTVIQIISRYITINDTQIKAEDTWESYYSSASASWSAARVINNQAKPFHIWGIKGVET